MVIPAKMELHKVSFNRILCLSCEISCFPYKRRGVAVVPLLVGGCWTVQVDAIPCTGSGTKVLYMTWN